MKIGLFWGSSTDNTTTATDFIKEYLEMNDHEVEIHNIADADVDKILEYDNIIIGCPTWHIGELQEDWDSVFLEYEKLDFNGKTAAFFGCGDQVGYPEWYQDAMGLLHDKLVALGGLPLGYWSTDGYTFSASKATTADGSHFVGLALDEDNQHELTGERIVGWCRQLEQEFIQ